MDQGKSSNDDLNNVQLNQAASNAGADSSSPLPTDKSGPSPVPEPAVPPIAPPVAPTPGPSPEGDVPSSPSPLPPPTPVPPPVPTPPTPPPPSPPSPFPPAQSDTNEPPPSEDNFGVGRPNIGVEPEDQKSSSPAQASAVPPGPPASQSAPPMQTDSSVNVKAVPPSAQNEPPSYTIPINKYSDKVSDNTQGSATAANLPLNPNLANIAETPSPGSAPKPPIKAPSSAAGTITVLAILALIVGGFGGFFGFRYFDRLKTTASTLTSSSPGINQTATTEKGKTYSSTKYGFSLEYPSAWFASTSSNQADEITFASNQESLSIEPTGYKVNIVFQDTNGKTLKDWVEANSAATGNSKPVKSISIAEKTAYQQDLDRNGPGVTTYLELKDKIMIVTYTAPAEMISEGGDFYNQIINSIKLS